jgi:hypothetical protein
LNRTYNLSSKLVVCIVTTRPLSVNSLYIFIFIYLYYSDSLPTGRSGDRIPVKARFSAPVQTGCEAHPDSCTMGTESFSGVNRSGLVVDHPPHLARKLKKEYSYTSTPPMGLRGLFYGEIYIYRTLFLSCKFCSHMVCDRNHEC